MPHTGRIDESLQGQEKLLMRARLHVEGSMKRFSEGEIEDAIAVMYDAISSAMQRYTYPEVSQKPLLVYNGETLANDAVLFKVLKRSNILDDTVDESDFDYLDSTLDQALEFHLISFDIDRFLQLSENLLTQMGVLTPNELPLQPGAIH